MITIPIWAFALLVALATPLVALIVLYILAVIYDLLFIRFYYTKQTKDHSSHCPYEVEGKSDDVQ